MDANKEPLPIGTLYDGSTIVEVIEHDEADDYQPFLYMLDNGQTVWIPALNEEGGAL